MVFYAWYYYKSIGYGTICSFRIDVKCAMESYYGLCDGTVLRAKESQSTFSTLEKVDGYFVA